MKTKPSSPRPKSILPLLQTILSQQAEIYGRLRTLHQMLSLPRPPIEPKVAEVLAPLATAVNGAWVMTHDQVPPEAEEPSEPV